MAYFSALGGTGGTSATITVTYSEDFYGTTITATNGTTTLTKTATSSGELVFNVSEGGTWIVSGVVEGSTYSERVDVTFEYSTPQLIALPNGSTVTPVNSIPIWLKCAMIRDKSYTTLSQVLADTDTLIALCADSNACDYMARSTNWASGVAADSTAMLIVGKYNYCANALLSNSTWASAIGNSTYFEYVLDTKVPTMTSDTTPSGQVIYSTQEGTDYAYNAFNDTSRGWTALSSDPWGTAYCGYVFPQAVIISKWSIKEINNAYNRVYRLEGSNDGVTYTTIKTSSAITTANTWVDIIFENTTAYRYYKCVMVSGSQSPNYGHGKKFQFYGRTPVSQDYTLIHSAVEDSIFYMDEGTPVALCTIASGDTEDVDMESFKGQTLTLVSTVAKDPTNLSNDFSMNVRITPNITEIYLMPLKALYWWGHECEVLTGGNNFAGWTSNYPGVGVSNGTAYTNHYDTLGSNGLMHGYGTVNKIYITDSDYVKCIVSYTNATQYKFLQANPDKKTTSVLDGNNPAPAPIIKIYSEGVASLDVSSYTGNYGIAAYTYHDVGMNVHAIWLE